MLRQVNESKEIFQRFGFTKDLSDPKLHYTKLEDGFGRTVEIFPNGSAVINDPKEKELRRLSFKEVKKAANGKGSI